MAPPLDEANILAAVAATNDRLPAHVLIPPGDDMALLALGCDRVLTAVDQVVVGVHVLATTPVELIARKAVARNISDVAAMGGIPVGLLACAALPSGMNQQTAETLLESVRQCGEEFGAPLVGGDTTIHGDVAAPLVLSITVLARPRVDGRVIRRGGAMPSDLLITSGPLGGSFGTDGLGRHLTFTPRMHEAHALIDLLGDGVHAMIDLSDGLGIDCSRLMECSSLHAGCALQAHIVAEQLPRNRGATIRQALSDGEDYELLAAIDKASELPRGWFAIGHVTQRPALDGRAVLLHLGDDVEDATTHGWLHGR